MNRLVLTYTLVSAAITLMPLRTHTSLTENDGKITHFWLIFLFFFCILKCSKQALGVEQKAGGSFLPVGISPFTDLLSPCAVEPTLGFRC